MALTEREKVAHLLRRFGLGASEAELDYYGANGSKGAMDLLLNYENVDPGYELTPDSFVNDRGIINMRVAQGIWYTRLVMTRRPLEEKMTIFWHNHFATASMKVDSAYAMLNNISTLRAYGTDNFRDLLHHISKDPAMIFWLDNQENVKGKPNENFAREVMELFTLGIGHYSEKDVQEAARAFTGWTYGAGQRAANEAARAPRRLESFRFVRTRFDEGAKTVLGKTGNHTGEDVLDLLCDHPQTARFIAGKMWSWFAYENPEPGLVDRLAKKFRDSNLEIKALIRAIMEAPEFYSEKAVQRVVKNPVDFTIPILRQLGIGRNIAEQAREAEANPRINAQNGVNIKLLSASRPGFATVSPSTSMGMELMNPPDVSGWRTGAYWITSATMVERAKFADHLMNRPQLAGGGGGGNQGRNLPLGISLAGLFSRNAPATEVVDKLVSVLDCKLSAKSYSVLMSAAETAAGDPNAMAHAVLKVLFVAPEFQFC
ncbi:MAG: DUF1800 domain-containing protein [Chthonomonas sp.]|nr:DUF1800 domain-containing protein [Chthonomonas sp.]